MFKNSHKKPKKKPEEDDKKVRKNINLKPLEPTTPPANRIMTRSTKKNQSQSTTKKQSIKSTQSSKNVDKSKMVKKQDKKQIPKVIASGTFGVIYKPFVLCKRDPAMNAKYKNNPNIIMKVDKDDDPNQIELKMCKLIHKADPEEKFTLPLNGDFCVIDYDGEDGKGKKVHGEERVGYFCGYGGPTLWSKLIEKKPMDLKMWWRYYCRLVKALVLLDRHNLHHGDLNFNNIVLVKDDTSPDGLPKLIDFARAFTNYPDEMLSIENPHNYAPVWLNAAIYVISKNNNPKTNWDYIIEATHKNYERYYDYFGWNPNLETIDSDPMIYYIQKFSSNNQFMKDFIKMYRSRIDIFALTHYFSEYGILFLHKDREFSYKFKPLDDIDYAIYTLSLPIFKNILDPKVENTWSLHELSTFIHVINHQLKVDYNFDL